jgi:hypothetical protein
MAYIGTKPADKPLTSADITDGIITSAKIVDATIANADIANSTINLTTKVTGTLPVANGGTGLTALGTSLQVLRTNTGATALEYATLSTGASAGQIIQVVTATDSTERSTTSTSFVLPSSCTLSLSITPSSASNKIFILCSLARFTQSYSTYQGADTIFRDSTNIGNADKGFGWLFFPGDANLNVAINYLDSPATTSAITYQWRCRVTGSGAQYLNNGSSQTSSITAFEVKG